MKGKEKLSRWWKAFYEVRMKWTRGVGTAKGLGHLGNAEALGVCRRMGVGVCAGGPRSSPACRSTSLTVGSVQ